AEPPALLSTAAGIALDDLEEAVRGRPERERSLFHIFNIATAAGGRLLVTGRRPPARWQLSLPDLASRLASLVAVEIKAPDDALLEAVLVKLFADRQLTAKPEVIRFLSARMERSLAAAGSLVAALDRASLAKRREVSVPLAREVLAAAGSPQS
ncbi:MAG: HdaA/DnaA family protein, partial [Kiloniellales bacterium]